MTLKIEDSKDWKMRMLTHETGSSTALLTTSEEKPVLTFSVPSSLGMSDNYNSWKKVIAFLGPHRSVHIPS